MAFDVNTGNIWITAIDDNLGELFTATPSATGAAAATGGTGSAGDPIQITGLGTEVAAPTSKTACGSISVAVDKNSTAWFVTAGGTSSNCGATTAAALNTVPGNITATTAGTAISTTNAGLNAPTQVMIDGNNNVFIANTGASSVVEYSQKVPAFESGTAGFIPASADSLHAIYQPSYLQADRSGALWVLSSGNGTSHSAALVQILGVAGPTDPVLANGKYGQKP
jgi:hypothetical protein